ncbi:SulP family inorganic anion transporter [Fontivita pretiosa]|uniref:SulP family inorganic anion transporter n=1 Tax=Fontivita pretiosa TaxID=2989684 RepID=UPI003D17983F
MAQFSRVPGVSLLGPPIHTIRHYNLHKLRKDLLAGLTVCVVEIPQAMAYALVAGVPPVYGIYSSILQGVIGAMLSSSEHLTTGPTNTQSLLIASAATRVAQLSPTAYLELVFGLTLIKGLIQVAFAAARLGDLVRYVSRSVIVGVAAGAGVLIAVGQLPNLLGVSPATESSLPGAIGALERLWPNLAQTNPLSVMIGLGAIAVVVGLRLISRFAPGALLAVVLSGGVVALAGWSDRVSIIGSLPRGFPGFHIPQISLNDARGLFAGALALAILGLLESVAIGKSIAAHTGERIDPNQEFFAQGVKNALTSFFQCIPGSGSFTRSALDYAAGAETRFAAVFNALFVAAIFFCFADYARFIPLSSLAGVLMVIGYRLIDWRFVARIARTSRPDAIVCFATILATILAPLEFAIFVGIFLNIAMYLRTASRLHMAEMVQAPGSSGTFLERPLPDRFDGQQKVVFLQLEGDLFFAVADELQDHLTALALTRSVRVVILRLKRTHSIDATVLHVLERFVRDMRDQGRHVVLCGVRPELMRTLRAYGLIDLLGSDNVFEAGPGVFTSARRAVARARQLGAGSFDISGVDLEDSEEWAYTI